MNTVIKITPEPQGYEALPRRRGNLGDELVGMLKG